MARPRLRIQLSVTLCFIVFLQSSSAPGVLALPPPPPPPPGTLCIPRERDALLAFKAGLTDPSNYLSSWRGEEDCCRWTGVECSNRTGHVVKLEINSQTDPYGEVMPGAIGGEISPSLLTLRHLKHLDLSCNNFSGKPIPEFIGSFRGLTHLVLYSSSFGGRIPPHLGNLSGLISLRLSNNKLTGDIPVGLRELANLDELRLNSNDLHGTVTEDHFTNLTSLQHLWISDNSLTLVVNSTWNAPFKLTSAGFKSCILGPQFPTWISQPTLHTLDISNTSIHDSIPSEFWITMYHAHVLNISGNRIVGRLPTFSLFGALEVVVLDISSNQLVGPIPTLPKNLAYLDLSGNNLLGALPSDIGAPTIRILMLYNNFFSGNIPCSFFELQQLEFLDLSQNLLNGTLPNCPRAPKTSSMTMLNLNSNNLSGGFPSFLQRCKEIKFLDLAYNKFSGSIPTWIGSKLPYLALLRLRSNMLSGDIPDELTGMKGLQYLDIASNNISGNIPLSLGNLIAMAHTPDQQGALFKIVNSGFASIYTYTRSYTDSLSVIIKCQQLEYTTGIAYMVYIDFSRNSLTGQIPHEIGMLVALKSLNLSWNHLNGTIPKTVGELGAVESLDLAHNELSGVIPTSLADLTSLSHLNLSYNNLTGAIPSGNQLSTLDDQASIYIGNPGLCGLPVSRNCSGTKTTPQASKYQHEGMSDVLSLYLGIGTGFLAGLWIVFCGFLFKRNWRILCFSFSDRMYDWVCGQVMLSWASLTRETR